jgi:hypothetical protein
VKYFLAVLTVLAGTTSWSGAQNATQRQLRRADEIQISQITYHGWPHSYRISNGKVQAVVVGAIGRVMQFQFVGGDNVFWQDRSLDGKSPDPSSKQWTNFGGDKSWPSPQDEWSKMIGHGWPPPAGFDAVPYEPLEDGEFALISPVDPSYGIRVRRRIKLDPADSRMTITTTYEKVSGAPLKVGVGVITQLRDPERLFMVLPKQSRFPEGYVLLQFSPPEGVSVKDGLVSLRRGRKTSTQIGSDADTLLWMDEQYVLRIDSPRVPGAEYADQSTNTTIFTSPDPQAYVELESFGPLTVMNPGERIEHTNSYTLLRRTEKDPEVEARKLVRR